MRVAELVKRFSPEVIVLAGHDGLDASIRWVHATDLPDPSRYLRGGELILTNGQWRHRRADSERFVDSVSAAGVVAIGYGLTKAATRTPKDLIAACEAAGLPLLQIPHDMAFVAISEEVASDHAAQRERGLVGRLRRDEVLLRSVSRGGGLDGVLRILARDHGVPFVLVDRAGQTIGGAVPDDDALAVARAAAAGADPSQPTGTSADGVAVTVFPVTAAGAVEALLVCFRAIGEWSEDEQDAIRHELTFLGLELSRMLMSREFNERLADELLELVAEGEARTMELAARLRSFMIDPDRPLVAIALSVLDPDDTGMTRRAARAAGGMLSRRGVAGVAAVDGAVAIVIASSVDDATLAADLAQTLGGEGVPVTAAVGSPSQTGVRGLRRSVAEARLAADYAQLRGGAGGVTTYADAGSYRVLLAAQSADSRAAFARAVLGPVLDQDRDRGSDLIATLDAFLQDGGHWQRVAEELHLHVNTLRYRIGRVEQLTGRAVSSFEERVNLFIALEALRTTGGPLGALEDPPN
jgi:PucR family transcriptional regulator, purine catabolism regulatory protein